MEKIAIGVSISLVIIIASTIVLLMICGFIYRRRMSGKCYILCRALPLGVAVQIDVLVLYDFRISINLNYFNLLTIV